MLFLDVVSIKKIINYMESLYLTQENLAKRYEVSKTTIHNWKFGKQVPSNPKNKAHFRAKTLSLIKSHFINNGLEDIVLTGDLARFFDIIQIEDGTSNDEIINAVIDAAFDYEDARKKADDPVLSSEIVFQHMYNSNSRYDVQQDFEASLAAANNGSPKAMYEVALMYYYGIAGNNGTSDADYGNAFYWFEKLSELDSEYKASALTYLGMLYYFGSVPNIKKQSYRKSYELATSAAAINDEVLPHLAFLKLTECGCEYDYEDIEKTYLKIIDKCDPLSILRFANFYMIHGKYKEAAALYEDIHDTVPLASYNLGMMYKSGFLSDDKKPDHIKAGLYFHRATTSEFCDSHAYLELGKLYFNSAGGFPQDFKQAQKYLTIAYDMGSVEAGYILGYMYQYGHVELSLEKAIKCHTFAAEHGFTDSAVCLATIYQSEECKNYYLAYKWAKHSAERGSAEGSFIYANLLYIGRGCKPNLEEAEKYYIYAAEHFCPQAKIMLEKLKNSKNN